MCFGVAFSGSEIGSGSRSNTWESSSVASLGRDPFEFFYGFGFSLLDFYSNSRICFFGCSSWAICFGVAFSGSEIGSGKRSNSWESSSVASLGRDPLEFFDCFGFSFLDFDSNSGICFSGCSSWAICFGVAFSGSETGFGKRSNFLESS